MFMQVSQIFQRRKSDANKQDFENKFNLTCQAQSTHKTIGILTKVFCTSGPNFVVLAWTGDELSHGQAQNGVNFDFEVKFDLEGQGKSPLKTIGILTKVFYICGPNLVILAETGHELSRGQARDWHTDGHTHTDRRRQRQYPKANTGLGQKSWLVTTESPETHAVTSEIYKGHPVSNIYWPWLPPSDWSHCGWVSLTPTIHTQL